MTMWELIFFVILVCYSFLLIIWVINHKFWSNLMTIPGPKGYPIIGNVLDVIFDRDIFESERKRAKKWFPIFKLWSFNLSIVFLGSAEDIELVLSNIKHITKGHVYTFLHNWLGSGLLTSDGSKWQNRRKILTPAFHFNILQEFVHIFNRETNNLVERLEKECDKPYTDVIPPITNFALVSIGETSLGVNLSEGNISYKKAIHNIGDIIPKRLVQPWYHYNWIYKFSLMAREEQRAVKTLHDFSTNVVEKRKNMFLPNGEISYSAKKRLAMLDLMLKAKYEGADINDEGIREEVDTFMFEGHDTVSMILCLSLMQLANEPTIQDEILQEIRSIMGDSDQSPTYNELTEMTFMDRCIKECLRLYPSVNCIARIAGEDINTATGYVIPKGCNIFMYIYDLHRCTKYWEDPEKFDPDRFLPDNIARRHPFAYIPFSAGSRNCIGQKFAILEMKAVLCGILRRFKLEAVDTPQQIKFKADVILRPIGEVRVKFVSRK